MNRFFFCIFSGLFLFLSACTTEKQEKGEVDIIPVPVDLKVNAGFVSFDTRTVILYSDGNEQLAKTAAFLSSQLNILTGLPFKVEKANAAKKNSIFLKLDQSLNLELGKEGYLFHSGDRKIEITSATPAGIFYGIQTLYQLLPVDISSENAQKGTWKIPSVEITDYPRFSWRGMHLDVSRHFFPVDFVKKYIDLIAMHKMNIFHWHLTDDNGWRIEIRQYPLLTEVSAWHVDRESLPWDQRPLQQPGEQSTYGGFYTQDQIKEVIQYAAERYVTIIPEIEMPGHSSEVFAAYPELSCRGEKLTVQPGSYWPNVDILCAGKEETFIFIENVLKEVSGLFPSEYIHIGGDEADKTRWRACPNCQARIKKEQLSGEDELQSYFIHRVEKMLTGMGKKLIGWDEILEGGLAPEATVMSWRGYEGGIEAARMGHDVIMCPTNYCYFDYYQADPEFQPEAIGGLVPLKKVYSFNPVPSELNAEEARHILGGQGNLWTEYIQAPEKAEYMAIPRMTALAEVLWSPEKNLDWSSFRSRLQTQFERFEKMNVNYCEGSGKVGIYTRFNPADRTFSIHLETETPSTEIFYTTNGDEPGQNSNRYQDSIIIKQKTTLKAVAFKDGKKLEKPAVYDVAMHTGIGKKMIYNGNYSERYRAGGDHALNDGLKGSLNFNDGMWQGFNGNNLDALIELGEEAEVHSIAASFLQDQKKWIFLPVEVVLYVSDDGINFTKLTVISQNIPQKTEGPVFHSFEFNPDQPLKSKFIRIEAINPGKCPPWHEGNGQKCWIFADEIVIN